MEQPPNQIRWHLLEQVIERVTGRTAVIVDSRLQRSKARHLEPVCHLHFDEGARRGVSSAVIIEVNGPLTQFALDLVHGATETLVLADTGGSRSLSVSQGADPSPWPAVQRRPFRPGAL